MTKKSRKIQHVHPATTAAQMAAPVPEIMDTSVSVLLHL
jgi:hypothetical protein